MDVPYFVEVDEARRIAAEALSVLPLPAPVEVTLSLLMAASLPPTSLVGRRPAVRQFGDGRLCHARIRRLRCRPRFRFRARWPRLRMMTWLRSSCVRILTGAPMPPGADAILPIERCDVGDGEVTLTTPRSYRMRSEARREPAQRGRRLVCRRPPHAPARSASAPPWAIRPSGGAHPVSPSSHRRRTRPTVNRFVMVKSTNRIPRFGGFGPAWAMSLPSPRVEDTLDGLREALDAAAATSDMIVTSGGVSMGEWDLVRRLMEEEGDLRYWRVKIRPGSPPLFGLWKGTPLFGLPGNPVSSHVVFRLLVADAMRAWTGATGPIETTVRARLLDPVKSTNDCLTLRRVTVRLETARWWPSAAPSRLGQPRKPRQRRCVDPPRWRFGAVGEIIDVTLLWWKRSVRGHSMKAAVADKHMDPTQSFGSTQTQALTVPKRPQSAAMTLTGSRDFVRAADLVPSRRVHLLVVRRR